MSEGKPVAAGCIGGEATLFACPVMLQHGGRAYPKAAIVAAAQDIYHFHFADHLAELMGSSAVAVEEVMCQTDKRCLNAAQLRRLRAIMEGQAESFSRLISDRYAQLGHLATIVSQKEELGRAYDQLDGEFKTVGALQRSLVPREPPSVRGFKIATHYVPARRAGGDYYDFLPQPTGPCVILVADVSGHGPGAAVVMAMMRAILHTFPTAIVLPEPVMKYLNDHLCRSIMHDQFATAFLGLFSPDGRVQALSAGHESPLLFDSQTGEVHAVEIDGALPLGVVSDIRLARTTLQMKTGDVMLIYTDGVTDTRNTSGDAFGADHLTAVLRANAAGGAVAVRNGVVREIFEMAGGRPLDDDQALVVVERQ
jgi:sigma-B regulation protein RsbU (phosphoserine phosphatase)